MAIALRVEYQEAPPNGETYKFCNNGNLDAVSFQKYRYEAIYLQRFIVIFFKSRQ